MNNVSDNNFCSISGKVIEGLEYSHTCKGERFYQFRMGPERRSGILDIINVIMPERICAARICEGDYVNVKGQFRSRNIHTENSNHLMLFVFAFEINNLEKKETETNNYVELDGYICKEPKHRLTPSGIEIADMLIAIGRRCGRSDYIPCIVWGRNAQYVSTLDVGTHIQLEGRIQSREYLKKLDDGTQETRTAYEVSVSRIEVVESEESEDESRSEKNL